MKPFKILVYIIRLTERKAMYLISSTKNIVYALPHELLYDLRPGIFGDWHI